MPNLVELIKKAAMDAVKASNPTSILYGIVASIDPISINIEQRLTLDESHLILTSNVRDYDVEMTLEDPSNKEYVLTFKVKLGLKVNENVILIQLQGGQKYVVLDRAVI